VIPLPPNNARRAARHAALRATVPVLWGYLAIGMTFGCLLYTQTGHGWPVALLMSIFMYAGAMQYMAVPLIAQGADLLQWAVVTFLVNARHMVYGLSLFTQYERCGRGKPYAIFALTDEAYALLAGAPPPPEADPGTYTMWVSWLCQSYWVVGSALGNLLVSLVQFDTRGIDFTLTALFLVILHGQWQQFHTKLPFVVGAGCAALVALLFGTQNMLLLAVLAVVAALMFFKPRIAASLAAQDARDVQRGGSA
jgi:4-azaleucine resistance transporter AzlC